MSEITQKEAMGMNRHQRRALAKANGVDRIPGSNRADLKLLVVKKLREVNASENIISFYKKYDRMPKDEDELKKHDAEA